jgi:hypothetical protein
MVRGQRKFRVIGAALALLGVALYALLIPGHLTSQFKSQLYLADVGEFAGALCSSNGSSPAMPATSCPICKSLASFQLALAPPDAFALPVVPHTAPAVASVRDDVAELSLPRPKSRGPPLPTA